MMQAVAHKMRAVVQTEYGGIDRLGLGEVERPEPGRGEVLVHVRAAAIDRGTWHLMTGMPLIARPAIGIRRPRSPIIGRDLAGVVTALGEGVDGFAVGDEVIGTTSGSVAEYVTVDAGQMTRKPQGVSFEEAATLPISGITAWQAVVGTDVQAGQRVLITGASGGVGSYAVQIAAHRGARVTAVCSGAKADWVRSLGADDVIDYTRDEIDAAAGPFDVILDIAGNRSIADLRRLLRPNGTLMIVGGETDGRIAGGTQRQLYAMMLSPFVRHRLTGLLSKESGETMAELTTLVEAGAIRPTLDRSFAMDEIAPAMAYLTEGRARGKVAITV